MADPVFGRNVVLELLNQDDSTYYPVLCGVGCVFNYTPEFVAITTAGSGSYREFMPRREEWDVSITGLTKIENGTSLTFFHMVQTSVRMVKQTIRITYTDIDGASKQIDGDAYIGASSINGQISEFATASIYFRGTGAFTLSAVTPPDTPTYDVYADYWTAVASQSYISGASTGETDGTAYTLLGTDIILDVVVENQTLYAVSGTPVPGQPEYRFVTSPVKIEVPLTFEGGEKVYVMFKREL